MLNLATLLVENARRTPDATAVRLGDHLLSYGELDRLSSKVAQGLHRLGIEPGEHVALSCPNLPWFPIVYFGILKAGCAVVPLNILLTGTEIAYHLADSQSSAYFCFEGTTELPIGQAGSAAFAGTPSCRNLIGLGTTVGRPAAIDGAIQLTDWLIDDLSPGGDLHPTRPDDTAVILYTSGTTGRPKGAELSHSNLFMNARVCADMMRYTADDRMLVVLPLFHSFGQVVLMVAGLLTGAELVLLPRFEPEAALRLLQDQAITVFAGVPTMYWALLHTEIEEIDPARIAARLRLCVSGGASLPVQVLHDFEARFQVPILEGYGLSETSPVACFNQLETERKPGSIGTPIWGVDIRLRNDDGDEPPLGEPGELQVRGHNVMTGYYNRPEATAETIVDGWLRTGDVARIDENGHYYIVDRTKDMIIRGGFNVYPREIEETLMQHPDVSLASVIGIPHDEYGEEIKAFIVATEGSAIDSDSLVAWSRERLAAYKYPRHVELRDSLPMNATGKVLKRELRVAEISTS